MIKRVKRLIVRRPSRSPSFCNLDNLGENPNINWTAIDALIYGKIFKVNNPITKVSLPANVHT